MEKQPENKQVILFFDGVCGLCNGFVDFVITADTERKFHFATLQGETAQEKLPKEFHEEMNSFVLLKDEKTLRKSSAALSVFSHLGGIWKVLVVFSILPTPIRDFFYDVIARNRYRWFGKKETCRLPTAEERSVFLD